MRRLPPGWMLPEPGCRQRSQISLKPAGWRRGRERRRRRRWRRWRWLGLTVLRLARLSRLRWLIVLRLARLGRTAGVAASVSWHRRATDPRLSWTTLGLRKERLPG